MNKHWLASLVLSSLLIAPAGHVRAAEPPAPAVERRVVLRAVTGFPDMMGLELGLRPAHSRFDLELGGGAGPFVARLHLHVGPSFLLSDGRQADGPGWEVELLTRGGVSICAGATPDELESTGCFEAGLGVEATRWFSSGWGLNLRLLGGGGYVVGGPKLGVTAYPLLVGTLGLAI